jgi:hypothetical protein
VTSSPSIRLGLGPNLAQFSLLVVVNAFVGAMVGLERSILPAIAEDEFHLAARAAVLSFIVVFGVTKALTNYFAGRSPMRGAQARWSPAGSSPCPVPFLCRLHVGRARPACRAESARASRGRRP